MANGRHRLSTLFSLQGADKGSEHFSHGFAALHQVVDLCTSRYADANRKQRVRLQLLQRPLRDAQELNEASRVLPPVTFRNIGRNRPRRAPDLRCQSEQFVARKLARQYITRLRQGHGIPPNPQVPIRIDRWVAQKSSLFATRHSLFATSLLVARQDRIIRSLPR